MSSRDVRIVCTRP